jgi:branched-chain amino acid transport system substrate-binding protein
MLPLLAALSIVQTDTIKIGALFSTTGSYASTEKPALQAFQLAAKQINEKGGLLGKQIEVITVDVQSEPSKAAAAAQRLIAQGAVALGGFYDTDYAIPAGRVAAKAHIPFVTSGATLPTLPSLIGQWFFMACFGDDDQARAAASFAHHDLNLRSAAVILDEDSTYTLNLAKYFGNAYRSMGGKLLQKIGYTPGARMATVAAKLKVHPEVVYVAVLPVDAGPITSALRRAGYDGYILSGDGFDTPDLVRIAGKAAEKVFFTTHFAPANRAENVLEYKRAYHAEYGSWPSDAIAALSFDTMSLIASAVERAGSADPARIRTALAETRHFEGVTGTISYSPGVRKPKKTVFVLEVKGGKKQLAKAIPPTEP